MKRYIWICLAAAFFFSTLSSAGESIDGYFKTAPGLGGATKFICVKRLSSNSLRIFISAGYCPSEACANYRPAQMVLVGKLESNVVVFSDTDGCKLRFNFDSSGVRVGTNGGCTDKGSWNNKLYAEGDYKFVSNDDVDGVCDW